MEEYIPLIKTKKRDDTHSVYISNLPNDVTKFDIRELVTSNDLTPLHCIVATNRKTQSKYGFAIFSTPDEANQCVSILQKTSYCGKLLNVELSKPKYYKWSKSKKSDGSVGFVKNSFIIKGYPSQTTEEQVRGSVTSILNGVPFTLVRVGDKWRFVFENLSTCLSAATKLSSVRVKVPNGGTVIIHSVLPKIAINNKSAKVGRIFVKNLPFNITSDELASKFTKIDPNCTVHFTHNENTCVKGFAFVQFTKIKLALKALKLNGTTIKGRKVEIHLAVSKEYFTSDSDKNNANNLSDECGDDIMDIDDSSDIEKHGVDKFVTDSVACNNDTNDYSYHVKDAEMEDLEDLPKQNNKNIVNVIKSAKYGDAISKNKITKVTLKQLKMRSAEITNGKPSSSTINSDVNEGKTAFVQNVPFEATQEQLESIFRVYGELEYAKLVKDPAGRNKGTAFVKFMTKESLDNLLSSEANTKFEIGEYLIGDRLDSGERSAENLGIALLGRKLRIVRAVTRDEAKELESTNVKVDRRRLYLLKESLKGISEEQRGLLTKGKNRENRIDNPNTFVSDKRICIRNLPIYLTKQELRDKLKESVKGIGKIQLLADKKRKVANLNGKRIKRGKRFGFVEFKTRGQAKLALKFLNNTNAFGQKLVAEFSLEDKRALMERERKAKLIKLR
ncbi:RNA recognition motif. (a.k.a. RRM RBD or RNP domain) [Babesia microti strain RI]|uniref:RNA recognition motif. (A.k.a. RRM RBD or RNP domain) n=1 Tax=Babesia microti (strain RI) TaxID=1133968 RepID=A0A1N6LY08_BABMR|nr:RNA recognition motif. (a.k.a. RRM RBD or RNP domain) [Babesia microti strain RI]SIO73744.1 RNA recognition motif. (a.k.a. RRM RBD or RNP domain) [Babesia microti strain RI]|eukprot:XP_021337807.1 RNA recognition motif. (a.k.a. RRM RBD or RNP domain) [Babesia microti strain RI]